MAKTTAKVVIYRDDIMAAVGDVRRISMKEIALAAQGEARAFFTGAAEQGDGWIRHN